MDTRSMFGFMDFIVLAGGLYVLYGYYLLAVKGEMKQGLIIPKELNPKKCSDPEGFKKAMEIPTLIFGLMTLATGIAGLYQDFVRPLPFPFYWILFFAFLGVIVWYTIINKKATDKYFRRK